MQTDKHKHTHILTDRWTKHLSEHIFSKVMPIHFINGNEGNYYYYVGLICNSMVCCSIWIDSAHNAGMKSVIVLSYTITIFLPALLTLIIPNTTANHTITYTIRVLKRWYCKTGEL